MRLVLDTNVLVSALLTPAGPPSRVLELILTQRAQALVDERILAESREVLGRQKLKLDPSKVTIALDFFDTYAEKVSAAALDLLDLPDPDDLPFLEVSVGGRADALVTGNARHFPDTRGVLLLSPRQLLERLRLGLP